MLTYRVGTKHRRMNMSRDEPCMRGRPGQSVFRYPRVRRFDKMAQQRIRARRRDRLVLDDRVEVLTTINAHLQPRDAGYQSEQECASAEGQEARVHKPWVCLTPAPLRGSSHELIVVMPGRAATDYELLVRL